MDFSLRRIGSENMHYAESDTESSIQLIFCPGGFNPEIWKNQFRYFSRKYKTIGFRPTESNRDFEGEKRALEQILEKESVENAVLISNIIGNPLVQAFEDHENVTTTVLTGVPGNKPKVPKKGYNLGWKIASKKPKLLKKFFFSDFTDLKILKRFTEETEIPEYDNLQSFLDKDVRKPVKLSMVIHAEEDALSSLENAKELDTELSVIQRAGTFSFYEKPQEYNKALNDFLDKVQEQVKKKEIIKSSEENRSLIEFEKDGRKEVKISQ